MVPNVIVVPEIVAMVALLPFESLQDIKTCVESNVAIEILLVFEDLKTYLVDIVAAVPITVPTLIVP